MAWEDDWSLLTGKGISLDWIVGLLHGMDGLKVHAVHALMDHVENLVLLEARST